MSVNYTKIITFIACTIIMGCNVDEGNPSSNPTLQEVTINFDGKESDTLILDKGQSVPLSAFGHYDNGNTKNITDKVIWQIDDDLITQIDNSTVYGNKIGATRLIASFESVISDPVNLLVSDSNVLSALKSGNVEEIDDIQDLFEFYEWAAGIASATVNANFQEFYPEGQIYYEPQRHSVHFSLLDSSISAPLIVGNSGRILAALTSTDNYRALAFGDVVIYRMNGGEYIEIEPLLINTIKWMLDDKPEFVVGLVNQWDTNFNSNQSWFKQNFNGATIVDCRDIAIMMECLSDADLIVSEDATSEDDATATISILENVLAKNKAAFIYNSDAKHQDEYSYFTKNLSRLAGVSPYSNYWGLDSANWESWSQMFSQQPLYPQDLMERLNTGNFSIDFSSCNGGDCKNMPASQDEFFIPADKIQRSLISLDNMGQDIFLSDGFTFEKLHILIGDKIRQSIQYPMDKDTTDVSTFLRALYADFSVKYRNKVNAKQNDLGLFHPQYIEFSDPVKELEIDIKILEGGGFHQLGVYALPGETFRIKRMDNQPLDVSVFINSIYSEATLFADDYGYAYPSQLRTVDFKLTSEELEITSPYGGPIYVRTSYAELEHPTMLSFRIKNVASDYPFLDALSQAGKFKSLLASTSLNWTGIKTDFVEIMSTTETMQESIDLYSGNVDKFIGELWQYTISGTYNLAGFTGDGLELSQDITRYCDRTGIECVSDTIHKSPRTQHVLVAPGMVGCWGCSGNPYRQSWPLNPLGWGETHEIGHNLQTPWTKIYDNRSNEASNNIFPMKIVVDYFDNEGVDHNCTRQKDSIKRSYEWLQQAQKQNQPLEAMYNQLWEDDGYAVNSQERLNFYLQLPLFVEQYSMDFDSGWDLFTILYLQERLIKDAMSDSIKWNALRSKIGLEAVDFNQLQDMTGNDFILVTLSNLTQRDFRELFTAWGIDHGELARTVLTTKNYPDADKILFKATNQCLASRRESLPIDGVTIWD